MWRRWGILTNFLLALMNFEKPKKSEFRKNEKSTRRCHRFKLVQQKTQSNDICLLRVQSATDPVFCHFGPIFALLPQYWPQKLPADTILLHMCAINQDHIMYGSWDIKYKGQSFLSFCAIFCPLSLLTTPKIKGHHLYQDVRLYFLVSFLAKELHSGTCL